MSFLVRFTPKEMSTTKYDEIIRRLEAAGAGAPKGRLYHVAFGDQNELRVSDIWDTRENFDAFGPTLMPILQEVGVDPGTPDFIDVYNIMPGEHT
jgi:hypothetical protein